MYGVRPEHLSVVDGGDGGVPATVTVVEPTGADTYVYAEIAGAQVCAVFSERYDFAPGQTIQLRAEARRDPSVRRRDGQPIELSSSCRKAGSVDRSSVTAQGQDATCEPIEGVTAMSELTRRDVLKAGVAASAAAAGGGLLAAGRRAAQTAFKLEPEKGAKLRVLRWSQFVQGDGTTGLENTKKFSETTGIEVRVDKESWEDLRPKAAVAANVGAGPDIIIGTNDDPHQFPDKLLDLTDLATYLGDKYGGWYDVCLQYGMRDKRWIALPQGTLGRLHRLSHQPW